jgi:CxxC motif-containing protein
MSNTKTISVKVEVSVLIKALQKALADREVRYAKNEKLEADYDKAKAKYEAERVSAVLAFLKTDKSSPKSVSNADWRASSNSRVTTTIELRVEMPTKLLAMEAPTCPDLYREYEYNHDKEVIQSAIRVLEMSVNEVVSTSTYHSVVKYL